MAVARTPSEAASVPCPAHTSLGCTAFSTEVSLFGEADPLVEGDKRLVVEEI